MMIIIMYIYNIFCRSSLKAAIVLQPLLGISNFLQIVDSPYDVRKIFFLRIKRNKIFSM